MLLVHNKLSKINFSLKLRGNGRKMAKGSKNRIRPDLCFTEESLRKAVQADHDSMDIGWISPCGEVSMKTASFNDVNYMTINVCVHHLMIFLRPEMTARVT